MAFTFVGVMPADASGTTIEVTVPDDRDENVACPATGDDECTLREAIGFASPGDTVLLPDEGPYLIGEQIHVTTPITIRGASRDTTIQPEVPHTHRIFDISAPGGTITIEKLTLESGGGTGSGGAARISGGQGAIEFDDSRFVGNSANPGMGQLGGSIAIANFSGSISVSNTSFEQGQANRGGGISARGLAGMLSITQTDFHDNHTSGASGVLGGAVFIEGSDARLEIHSSRFADNSSRVRGGGLAVVDGAIASVTRSTFVNNAGQSEGGALRLSGGSSVDVVNSTFLDSSSTGGVAATDGSGNTLTLQHVTIADHDDALRIDDGDTVRVLDSALSGVDACDVATDVSGSLTDDAGSADCADAVVADLGLLSSLHAPLLTPAPDSPLTDNAVGDCPDHDQRGVARTSPCTVGAVEVAGIVCPAGELPRDTEISCDLDVALSGADTSVSVQHNGVLFDDDVDLANGAGTFSFVIPADDPDVWVHVSVEGGVYDADLPVVPIGGGGGSGGDSGSGGNPADRSVVDGGGPDRDSVATTLAFTGAGTPMLGSLGVAMILAGLLARRTSAHGTLAVRAGHAHRDADTDG